ncbi:MAG: hypothetical protein QXV77_03185 [Candidatus Bathyarchaeia archaeon]
MRASTLSILIVLLSLPAMPPLLQQLQAQGGGEEYPLSPSDPVITSALDYLRAAQTVDGDVGGPSTSAWVVMALAAAGEDPYQWRRGPGSPSLMDYLASLGGGLGPATDWERQILAVAAAGGNPYGHGGFDYVASLEGFHSGAQIGDPSLLNDDIWGLMALIASNHRGSPAYADALSVVRGMQNPDGGWGYAVGAASDVDDTAAAVMALMAAGEDPGSDRISRALNYLREAQNGDGGFPYTKGEASNAASTSWTILAIESAGQDPTSSGWSRNGRSPVSYLLGLQSGDGSFQYTMGQTASPEWMTAYAVTALLGKPYPVNTIDAVHVKVRVEAPSRTIWSGEVALYGNFTLEARNSGSSYTFSALTPLGALDAASRKGGFEYSVNDQYVSMDLYVDSIGGEGFQGFYGWLYRVNGVSTGYGSCKGWLGSGPRLRDGDEILWYYGTMGVYPLRLTVDETMVLVGEPLEARVETLSQEVMHNPGQTWPTTEWRPIGGVTVRGPAPSTYQTDSSGTASIKFNEPGVFELYAEEWGETVENQYIRSNRVKISVLKSFDHVVTWEDQVFHVAVKAPTQVSEFSFSQTGKRVSFKLSGGEEGTRIPCRVEIPNTLLSGTFQVTVDGMPVEFTKITNETHTILIFQYNPSVHDVEVIGTEVVPEFPGVAAAASTLLALYVYAGFIAGRIRRRMGNQAAEGIQVVNHCSQDRSRAPRTGFHHGKP